MDHRLETVRAPLRPGTEVAAEAAADLERAIASFERWGAKVPSDSRLRDAVEVLRDAESSGGRAAIVLTSQAGVRALQIALDHQAIAKSLPPELVADLRKDLETCFAGRLGDPASTESVTAERMQTQLVVRAAFIASGCTVQVRGPKPRPGRSRPDILLVNGASVHPVEVKRPQKWKNIIPRFDEGAQQVLDAGGMGGVVVDITDCLRDIAPSGWDAAILTALDEISATVLIPERGYLPGRSHIAMAAVFARPNWHIEREGLDATALISSSSAATSYGMANGTLGHLHGTWMRSKLSEGLNHLGYTSSER